MFQFLHTRNKLNFQEVPSVLMNDSPRGGGGDLTWSLHAPNSALEN